MTGGEGGGAGAPIDVPALEAMGSRAGTHPIVDRWRFRPDRRSPRRLELVLDPAQYPPSVAAARLDCRWFENGEYTVHYVETRDDEVWERRWDCHPEPGAPRRHEHPPPDAGAPIASDCGADHHLGLLFDVLDWVDERVRDLHERR